MKRADQRRFIKRVGRHIDRSHLIGPVQQLQGLDGGGHRRCAVDGPVGSDNLSHDNHVGRRVGQDAHLISKRKAALGECVGVENDLVWCLRSASGRQLEPVQLLRTRPNERVRTVGDNLAIGADDLGVAGQHRLYCAHTINCGDLVYG